MEKVVETKLTEVVGHYLFQPIANLLEDLYDARPEVEHFYPPVFLVNSYCAAIIPLALVIAESFVNAAQHRLLGKNKIGIIGFIRKNHPETDFADKINELYAARHAVVHSHMWSRKFKIQSQG